MSVTGNQVKQLDEPALNQLLPTAEQHLAASTNLAVMQTLDRRIQRLEQQVTGPGWN